MIANAKMLRAFVESLQEIIFFFQAFVSILLHIHLHLAIKCSFICDLC